MTDTQEREMHALAQKLADLTRGTGWAAMQYKAIGDTMERLAEYCAVAPPLAPDGPTLRALLAKWREKQHALARRADAQGMTQYAMRLGERSEQIAECADELEAALTAAGGTK